MEKEIKHRCSVCSFYESFYFKKDTRFDKAKDGYCGMCKQIKDRNETCDSWVYKSRRLFGRKWTTERVLKEIMFHLIAISQILQEDKDERREEE